MSFVETIRNAGIIGAGGAGFPTYVKMQSSPDTLICNAAECEPLLYTDYYVIQNHIEGVVRGILLAKAHLGAERAVFAIKEKRHELFPAIEKAIKEAGGGIEIFTLGDYYPAGDEQSLVHDVTGRIVPQNGIPIQVNVVVNNVLTFFQLWNAIENNVPVTERYVSVVGRVKHPYVAVVPIGTPFSVLAKRAEPEPGTVMLEGGVMMGHIRNPEDTVTKTTGALVFLEEGNPAVHEKVASFQSVTRFSKSACCQCTECTVLCPRFNLGHDIEPHMIMRTLNYGLDANSSVAQAAYLCCQCGVCSMFACPFGLSPKRVYADFRARLKEFNIPAREHAADPFNDAKKLPSKRLKARLNILDIDVKAEFIGTLPYPGPYKIRMKQHIGAPATPIVKIGDRVRAGQVLATVKTEELGTPVHSPAAGDVLEITEEFITIGSES
ncbi:MAG: electron transport complex protein RnfC [Acidobacteria bacterium]|nr:MAG: electron transport complex protein RnfC [Acidobacteriota bacterium]